jgi:hypothetical protein
VQGKVGAIDRPSLAKRAEEFTGKAFKVGPSDGPPEVMPHAPKVGRNSRFGSASNTLSAPPTSLPSSR